MLIAAVDTTVGILAGKFYTLSKTSFIVVRWRDKAIEYP